MAELDKVEVAVIPPADRQGEYAASPLREPFAVRIEEFTGTIQSVADSVRTKLASELESPKAPGWQLDRIELEFSLELQAGAGVVLARASTTGGFAVTLAFARQDLR